MQLLRKMHNCLISLFIFTFFILTYSHSLHVCFVFVVHELKIVGESTFCARVCFCFFFTVDFFPNAAEFLSSLNPTWCFIFLCVFSLYKALPTHIPQDCVFYFSHREKDHGQEVGDFFSIILMIFNFVLFSKVSVDRWPKFKKCQKRCMTWLLFHIFSVFGFWLWAEAVSSINSKSQFQTSLPPLLLYLKIYSFIAALCQHHATQDKNPCLRNHYISMRTYY